ncbi:hypothetical protein FM104_03305 [Microbacterium esteraromaticum]|uniref:Uncharacterized protein n=1 Tax=Microbacterium esteraromaticum TaxID=57043 RepID=A0A1R4IR63_9MICO|nr:hypothetical protein FM104_03305 [Microbacterium esteraromaticum]
MREAKFTREAIEVTSIVVRGVVSSTGRMLVPSHHHNRTGRPAASDS